MKARILTFAVASVAITVASAAHAVDAFNTNVDVYVAAGPEFIAGSGIPINGFAQDSLLPFGPNTISVALKPRDRDTGQANAIIGNRYIVDPGFSTTNPAVTNLAIDFQFDPGIDGTTNFILRQSVDFDPAFGATDFAVITLPIFGAGTWDDSDGYFTTNTGGGAWNDATVPYVISNTTRQDFAFWNTLFGKTYDPNAPGEYEYRLEVLDPSGSIVLADITAFAQVVPEPASLALLGVAGVASLAVRRRVRSQRGA